MKPESVLTAFEAKPWKRTAGWLVPGENCTWLQYLIVRAAFCDVGIVETPLGSNRGIRIDEWTRRAKLAPPQWWCAIWSGKVWIDCGATVPAWYPLTDHWVPHLHHDPVPGAQILYGDKARGVLDAHHIGIVARVEPLLLTIEGNRGAAGARTNNGIMVGLGPPNRNDIFGYIHPVAVPGWSLERFAPAWFLAEHGVT